MESAVSHCESAPGGARHGCLSSNPGDRPLGAGGVVSPTSPVLETQSAGPCSHQTLGVLSCGRAGSPAFSL